MRETAAQTTIGQRSGRLRRVLAGALSTMLVAGGLVAASVAAPIVQAPAASAAANFVCGAPGAPQLYMTSNVANERRIFQLDANSATASLAYAPTPAIAAGTLNQLATSRDGTQLFWTDGATATSSIYEYTPGGGAGAGVQETTVRGAAAASGNTMGGYDLATNRYVFGGATFVPNTPTNLVVHSYNPTGNVVTGGVATITLPNAAGGNGDLAFSPAGTMYVVSGGNTTAGANGGLDDAQLYRVTGGIPTTGTTNLTAVALGGRIDQVRGLNSIAFGADGYLYLFGTNPTTLAAQLIKVNPSNGDIVSRTTITGATTGATDLASCASPSTVRGEVVLDEPRQDPTDQVQVSIGGGGLLPTDPSTTGTTTGTGTTVTNNPVTGPVILLPGDTATVTQQPAAGSATPASEYAQEWVCRDTAYGNAIVSSGFGSQASFVVPRNPAIGSNVVCSFSNREAVSAATIDKTFVSPATVTAIGQQLTYSITVTNTGTVPLQNVAVTDPAPGLTVTCPAGATTVNPIGQFNTVNSVTCTATRPATAADFQGTGTVDNTATVSYTTQQTPTGGAPTTASDSASFTPDRSAPAAAPDASNGNVIGQPVTVNVLANDPGANAATVRIVDPATGLPLAQGAALVVANQGRWTVDPTTGAITFTPAPGFSGDPTPIRYVVAGPNGVDSAPVTVTVDYAPGAVDDTSNGNLLGAIVVVPVTANDLGGVVPGTVQLLDPTTGAPVAGPVVVAGGTWRVDPETGSISYTPAPGSTANPAPIGYEVRDAAGTPTRATVTVTFQPVAADDVSSGNAPGVPINVAFPLSNDRGDLDPATFAFVDPATDLPLAPGAALVVPGQGTWTYDPANQLVVFTNEPGFLEDPTPVDYVVSGPGGTTGATITLEVSPLAADDVSRSNTIGAPVSLSILGNDAGDFVATSVLLIHPDGQQTFAPGERLVVDGQGAWVFDAVTGLVTFTPAAGFEGDPTPIGYLVDDVDGERTSATVTVDYLPQARDDESQDNAIGSVVSIAVLANDSGDLDPTSLSLIDATGTVLAPGAGFEVVGEGIWTIDPLRPIVRFTPATGFEGDPTPIRYQVADPPLDLATATITVDYLPVAVDDSSVGNAIGSAVRVDVLANDAGVLDLDTVALVDPETGEALAPGAELVVADEGTWTIDATTGAVTFTPLADFEGDPTPVDYEVADLSGDVTSATITVGYLPVAQDDADLVNDIGDAVQVDVLANDAGVLDPATVALIDPATGTALAPGASLTVVGQGVWSIRPTTGAVTFTPATGYEGDPAPVRYQVADLSGDVTSATITVGYVPSPVDDEDLRNVIGEAVSVDVLANDVGVYDPATVALIDPATGTALAPGASLTVVGEGVWSIAPTTGAVTFTPAEGYEGDPAVVTYQVADLSGDVGTATITVTYLPVATDDADVDNVVGAAVTVDVLANDAGVLTPATVAIVDPETGEALEPGVELVVAGEGTWTIDPTTGAITFTPETGFEGDPTPIDYVVEDRSGDQTGATVTVGYVGVAADDADLDNAIGEPVTIDVLANDTGVFSPATVALLDPETGLALAPGAALVVANEGTWRIDPATGAVTFTPAAGFEGDPTPVRYQVADLSGDVTGATITVGYLPVAVDDASEGNVLGQPAVIDVLANDAGVLDPTTIAFLDPETGEALEPGAALVVTGEGRWTIDPVTGIVTFTPVADFEGDPTPVGYQVADLSGDLTDATITVDYQPVATADESLGNALGTTVTVPVLANDSGDLDPATVAIVDPETGEPLAAGAQLVVEGEGTWTIDRETGAITFAPVVGFVSDPTPIAYVVEDRSGTQTGATVTVDYLQVAADDALLDQPIGQPVTVPVLDNDQGDLDPATLAFVDALGVPLAPGASLVIANQGTWTIDPVAGTVTFTPQAGYLGDPTPVRYQVADRAGDVVSATVTVSFLPVANDDEDLANAFGEVVTIDVLANDVGDFDATTVRFVDADGVELEAGQPLVVVGEGTWSIDPATGAVTFTPEPGYGGDPTPVTYRVTDSTGDTAQAIVTITYGPTAVDDASLRNAQGTTVVVDVLANDLGQFDPASVRIVSGDELVLELVVAGEGTWTVDPATGAISFAPQDGFTGNPTPIAYAVTDVTGDVTTATVVVTYLPVAAPDVSSGNAPGTAVTVDPLANDAGDLDPTTVEIRDPQTGGWGSTVVVPGEGTWTVDPITGAITFTPERGFEGSPTPIDYRVTDVEGEVTQSTVTIGYDAVAPAPSAPGPFPDLPRTGGELTMWALLAGLGLLLVGAVAMVLRRRRTGDADF
ncbi:hypothetical protein GCM10009846_01240 [Agrococcus versicolor]|uniref:Tandem-95 repeat protein n=1 Tax=Agrococcus versicolor TaxID=501482 RepID=A0ABP5M8M2_9MICO